jgi:hypothetical protein
VLLATLKEAERERQWQRSKAFRVAKPLKRSLIGRGYDLRLRIAKKVFVGACHGTALGVTGGNVLSILPVQKRKMAVTSTRVQRMSMFSWMHAAVRAVVVVCLSSWSSSLLLL